MRFDLSLLDKVSDSDRAVFEADRILALLTVSDRALVAWREKLRSERQLLEKPAIADAVVGIYADRLSFLLKTRNTQRMAELSRHLGEVVAILDEHPMALQLKGYEKLLDRELEVIARNYLEKVLKHQHGWILTLLPPIGSEATLDDVMRATRWSVTIGHRREIHKALVTLEMHGLVVRTFGQGRLPLFEITIRGDYYRQHPPP